MTVLAETAAFGEAAGYVCFGPLLVGIMTRRNLGALRQVRLSQRLERVGLRAITWSRMAIFGAVYLNATCRSDAGGIIPQMWAERKDPCSEH